MYNIDLYFHMTYFMYFFFICLLSAYTNVPKYVRKAIVYKYGLNNELFIEHIVEPSVETTVELEPTINSTVEPIVKSTVEKYEDKYLTKFKGFSGDYFFTEEEELLESDKFVQLMCEFETNLNKELNNIKPILGKIEQIIELYPTSEGFINKLTKYFDIKDEYEDDPDDYDLEELYNDLQNDYNKYKKELKNLEQTDIPEQELKDKARSYILDKKLDGYINNYVLETTPLGNVYMRYNHNKKSFEYFSNNTIPYRYLEAVGRKYVITFMCKFLFVDLEEELKKSSDKQTLEKENPTNITKDHDKNKNKKRENPKTMLAKHYGKEMKMEQNIKSFIPQIKVNLPNVKTNDNQLLKENANRYTWEGRISNLSLLKKAEKKTTLSFADFKKIKQNKS